MLRPLKRRQSSLVRANALARRELAPIFYDVAKYS
jgi:hypothetical protein